MKGALMNSSLTLVVDNSRAAHPALATRASDPTQTPQARASRLRRIRGVVQARLTGVRTRAVGCDDRGAVTAEYAIVIMAAVAFAGLLVAIMRSGEIRALLVDLVQNALGSAG